MRVDGMTKWQITMRVEMDGRPPWETTVSEGVARGDGAKIFEGAALPIIRQEFCQLSPANTGGQLGQTIIISVLNNIVRTRMALMSVPG